MRSEQTAPITSKNGLPHSRHPGKICLLVSIAFHIIAMLMLGAHTHIESSAKSQGDFTPGNNISVALVSASALLRPEPESQPGKPRPRQDNHTTSAALKFAVRPSSAGHQRTSLNGYYPAGKLTRLPMPLSDVDLNVSPINSLPATGKIELTLLVDKHGKVADVIPASTTVQGQALAGLVATQFRAVRFSPGEISGKKVNSRVTLVVISDPAKPLGSIAA